MLKQFSQKHGHENTTLVRINPDMHMAYGKKYNYDTYHLGRKDLKEGRWKVTGGAKHYLDKIGTTILKSGGTHSRKSDNGKGSSRSTSKG